MGFVRELSSKEKVTHYDEGANETLLLWIAPNSIVSSQQESWMGLLVVVAMIHLGI